MIKIAHFFLYIGIATLSYAQTIPKLDYWQDMQKIKSSQKADSALVNLWLKIANKISTNRPDSSIFFSLQALQVAKKIQWKQGIANANYQIGIANKVMGEYEKATENQLIALRIYEKEKDSIGLGNGFTEIATLYWLQKNYDKALENDKKALAIAEKQQNIDKISRTLNNIGVLLYEKKEYKTALIYYFNALKIAEQLKNRRGIASAYHNIGETYAAIHDGRGLEYLDKGLVIGREINDLHFVANTLIIISQIYQKQGNINESLKYAEEGYLLAKKIGAKEYVKEASNILYADYKMRHNMAMALRYHELYVTYKDSIYTEDRDRKIANLLANYELDNKRKELEMLAKEGKLQQEINKKQEVISYYLAAFMVLLLIFIAVLVGINRYRRKNNTILLAQKQEIERNRKELLEHQQQIYAQNIALSKQNEKLTELNNEKDGLVGIVAHDLRAPLNRIKGFAQILSFEENLNEDQTMMLKRIDKTCNAGIALIKDLLIINNIEYESTKIVETEIEVVAFLKTFIEQFEPQATSKQIKLHLSIAEKTIYLKTDENFMSRILDNILSNAIKFTHHGKNIFVRCEELADTILIAIKDEGQGLSKLDQQKLFIKFQKLSARPTAGEESTGLGLAIVKALIEKLGGEIQVISEQNEGAEFIIKLPKNKELLLA
jgi:signal transduction histidine kinase/tetratricopeptide (TPR) repeat protein